MRKKGKRAQVLKKPLFKLPSIKKWGAFKKPQRVLPPVLPQLLVILVCIGLYYAMIHFYIFFEWGFYIYYALKLLVAYELLSASVHTLLVPLCALLLGLSVLLFTNCLFLTNLMNSDTAWQLSCLGLAGCILALFLKLRPRYLNKGT